MKVAFYTLGCKVNLYETEVVMSLFKNRDYEIVDFNELADIYVINTCTVTNMSDVKGRKIIRNAIQKNSSAIIVVMGCYSQIKSDEIAKIKGVNIIIGNNNKTKIVDMVEDYLINHKSIMAIENLNNVSFEDMQINNFETRTRAFVKVQDGCNNYCSYCIIPYIRGTIRSKPMAKVINEIRELVNNGYVEVVLTGIHTGHYGRDLGDLELADLIDEISKIKGLKRIRISSIEVVELNDKMLKLLKNNMLVADHLHIPLQSGSDTILKLMNRRYDKEYFLNKINKIREIRPNISITTDVIVGFPGETDFLFNETYDFIKQVGFSVLHVFPYSLRSGTKAATMPNHIDGRIKKDRVKKLMNLSKELELAYMNKFIGQELEVIFETFESGKNIGHASNYLKVELLDDKNLKGQIKTVVVEKVEYPNCVSKNK